MNATNLSGEIARAACTLFQKNCDLIYPVRSLGVRAIRLEMGQEWEQGCLFSDMERRERQKKAEYAVDTVRERFGYGSIQRGVLYCDRELGGMNLPDPKVRRQQVGLPPSLFGKKQ